MEHENKDTENWLEMSQKGYDYFHHFEAMLPAQRLPAGKSYAISPGYNVGTLRKIAEGFKKLKITVIDHGDVGIEISRLHDESNVKNFYSFIENKNPINIENSQEMQKEEILRVISEFLNNDLDLILKYEPNAEAIRSQYCVSYSYILRRLISTAVFRKDSTGAKNALKTNLKLLEQEGLLKLITDRKVLEEMGTTAKIYKVF